MMALPAQVQPLFDSDGMVLSEKEQSLRRLTEVQLEVELLDGVKRLEIAKARANGALWREIGVAIGQTGQAVSQWMRIRARGKKRSGRRAKAEGAR